MNETQFNNAQVIALRNDAATKIMAAVVAKDARVFDLIGLRVDTEDEAKDYGERIAKLSVILANELTAAIAADAKERQS